MKKIIFYRSSMFIILLLLLVFTTFTGCKKDDNAPNLPANEVYIQNSAFSPSTITVTVNTTVKWTNKYGMVHTVTSNTGLFDSGSININSTFSY